MHPCVHQHLNVVSADERGKSAVIIGKGNVDVFISLMTECVFVCAEAYIYGMTGSVWMDSHCNYSHVFSSCV